MPAPRLRFSHRHCVIRCQLPPDSYTHCPNSAQTDQRIFNKIRPITLPLQRFRYLDTVEVWRSSRHGPTTFSIT